MDKRLQLRIFFRMFFLQGGWNFEGMQNFGFMYAIKPALERIYSGDKLIAAMHRHMEAFNTQPFMASFAIGLVSRLEENAAAMPPDQQQAEYRRISEIKRALASVTAAIGDRFFWGTIRAIGFVILLLVWWFGGFSLWTDSPWDLEQGYYTAHWKVIVVGIVTGVVFYNALPLWIRWRGLGYGYICESNNTCGMDYLDWQLLIKHSRRVGFYMAVVVVLLYLHTLVTVAIGSGVTAAGMGTVVLALSAGALAVLAKRRGISAVYLYLAAVGLAAMIYSVV